MLRSHTGIFNALLFVVLCFGSAGATRADTITMTLPDFNGTFVPPNQTFPRPTLTIGTFNFNIPAGQHIIGATLTGTFGNSISGVSSPLNLLFDGLQVAQCAPSAPCTGTFGTTGPTPFTFNFSNFSMLNDGTALLAFSQLGPGAVRLGNLTLTIQTPIPEPATMLLLGIGLAGVAAKVGRRKVSRGKSAWLVAKTLKCRTTREPIKAGGWPTCAAGIFEDRTTGAARARLPLNFARRT